jgi:hypothetical protein
MTGVIFFPASVKNHFLPLKSVGTLENYPFRFNCINILKLSVAAISSSVLIFRNRSGSNAGYEQCIAATCI